jgi:NAD-dependent deacetylase
MRPLTLLFDERYDGHALYQAHRARRALNDASVIVFVGTSFSVGITTSAMRAAQVSGARMVNVNLEPAPFPGVTELTGSAHELLPALAHELAFPTPERDTLPPPR